MWPSRKVWHKTGSVSGAMAQWLILLSTNFLNVTAALWTYKGIILVFINQHRNVREYNTIAALLNGLGRHININTYSYIKDGSKCDKMFKTSQSGLNTYRRKFLLLLVGCFNWKWRFSERRRDTDLPSTASLSKWPQQSG